MLKLSAPPLPMMSEPIVCEPAVTSSVPLLVTAELDERTAAPAAISDPALMVVGPLYVLFVPASVKTPPLSCNPA